MKVKLRIKQARPFLHVLMIFGPTLLIASFAGRKPALYLMILISCAIELAQFGFGYGFDAQDLLDLACDGAGIVLGLALVSRLEDWWKRRRTRRIGVFSQA